MSLRDALRPAPVVLALLAAAVAASTPPAAVAPAAVVRPPRVAVIDSGPMAELVADQVRAVTRLPAVLVTAADAGAAAKLVDAQFVVEGGKVWRMSDGVSEAAPAGAQAAAIVDVLARLEGHPLNDLQRAALAKHAPSKDKALAKWAEARKLYRARKYPEAVDAAGDAVRQDEGFAAAHAMLAVALIAADKKGNREGALAEVDAALKIDPASVAARLARAQVHDRLGEVDLAEQGFRDVLGDAPWEFVALNNLGLILFYERQDFAAAIDQLEQAAYADPTRPEPLVNLGLAYLELGQPEDAVRWLDQARARDASADTLGYLAEALARAGKLAPAREILDAAKAKGLSSPRLELAAAKVAYLDGKHDQALALLDTFLAKKPGNVPALTAKGRVLEAKGDLAAARAAWQQAVDKDRSGAREARRDLALLDAREGKLDAAIKGFDEQVQFRPRDAEAQYNHGVALSLKGDQDGARAAFTRALASSPRFTAAAYNLGLMAVAAGDPASAEPHLRLAADAGDLDARLGLAVALYKRGAKDEALAELQIVTEKGAGRTRLEAQRARGLIQLASGDKAKAKIDLDAYLAASPGATDEADLRKLLE